MSNNLTVVSEYNSAGNLISDKKYFLDGNPISYEQYKEVIHSPFSHFTNHYKGVIIQHYRVINSKQKEANNGNS